MDTAIQVTHELIDRVMQDEAAMVEYTRRQMALSDLTSTVNYALRERNKEIAREMKAKNYPMSEIIEISHLTEKQINEL